MELISNMYEFSLKLIGSLEDTIEATKEEEAALVGSIFDEFMEVGGGGGWGSLFLLLTLSLLLL